MDEEQYKDASAIVDERRAIASRNKRKRYIPLKLEPHRGWIAQMRKEGKSYGHIQFAVASGVRKPIIECGRQTVVDFCKTIDGL